MFAVQLSAGSPRPPLDNIDVRAVRHRHNCAGIRRANSAVLAYASTRAAEFLSFGYSCLFGPEPALRGLLLHRFLKAITIELEEQAAIDGCSAFGTFFKIVLPLLRPVTATLSIFISIAVWNDLALPLLFLPSGKNTVTLGVYSFISATKGFQTSQLFPAVVLGIAPLFVAFLILQRHIIAGITAGLGVSEGCEVEPGLGSRS
jgi:hypothetical protein